MTQQTSDGIRCQALAWIGDLESALRVCDQSALEDLFLETSYWRDLVAFTWDIRQFWGRDQSVSALLSYAAEVRPHQFRIAENRTPPRVLEDGTVDFFFQFETATGSGSAFVLARSDPATRSGLRARLLGTSLVDLRTSAPSKPPRRGYAPSRAGETWVQHRRRTKDLTGRDPDVLILGGGQSGLIMGARLEQRGVSYVIVDNHHRPGDGWRARYEALTLHTPVFSNDLPYVRQPDTFPTYASKELWANYLDSYAQMMDLNWWGDTEFLGADFDESERRWTVRLRQGDGKVGTMRPVHLVTALGYTGTEPLIPDLPHLSDFEGTVLHTSKFRSGADFAGKRVLVVGTGTSGHDIALDLSDHGATTFMCQRGAACVVPVEEAERFNLDYTIPGVSVDEGDQRRNSMFVYPLLLERAQAATERTERENADMFAALRKAGMKLTIGEDRSGWLMRLHRTFNGYYLDVGASQAIIDGRITVVQLDDIDEFVPTGVRMTDGSFMALDAVVLATGYRNVQATIEKLLGRDVAERVGPIGGTGPDGEHRNLARPTRQPHLWMLFGGIVDARKMSDLLALQIVANLEGIVPSLVRGEDGSLQALEAGVASLQLS